jgi:hypothetical protein
MSTMHSDVASSTTASTDIAQMCGGIINTYKRRYFMTVGSKPLEYIDTRVKAEWANYWIDNGIVGGKASILNEVELSGSHVAWQYYIEGLPNEDESLQYWLIDTGETVETSLSDDRNSVEKSYEKTYDKLLTTDSVYDITPKLEFQIDETTAREMAVKLAGEDVRDEDVQAAVILDEDLEFDDGWYYNVVTNESTRNENSEWVHYPGSQSYLVTQFGQCFVLDPYGEGKYILKSKSAKQAIEKIRAARL